MIKKIILLIACSIFAAPLQCQSTEPLAKGIEEIQFSFSEEPIDVIIPCTDKDIPTLDRCIQGIRTNCKEVRRVIVVSKKHLTRNAEWYDERLYPFSMFDIAKALFGSENKAKSYIKDPKNRLGWIYQQLLKLYAPFVIPGISSNVLVLDSDTIFLNRVTFMQEKGAGCFNTGSEYHKPYFKHAKRLLPYLHRVHSRFSGICHHMLFQKNVLDHLFQEVEAYHQVPFWKAFLKCVDHKELYGSCASEYEIYFNYASIRSKQFMIRQLKWQNISSLKQLKRYKKKGYHYVSCHNWSG